MNTEERLARLEERLTWLQRHTVEQDRVINSQASELESIKKILDILKKQQISTPDGNININERPPHY